MWPVLLMLFVVLIVNGGWQLVIFIMFGLVIAFIVNLVARQESMLYVPCVIAGMKRPQDNPKGMRSPADRGMVYEDVYLQTSDNLRIHAWFMPMSEPAVVPTLLFCHANAGNIGLRVPNFDAIVRKLKVNIFALDYRGYGDSEGEPAEAGLVEDALTAWRWLVAASEDGRIDGQRIFVFGRSLGGAVAVALGAELQNSNATIRPRGLLLENTFVSISVLVDSLFPLLAFKLLKDRLMRLKWDTEARIADLELPILFLTGQLDEIVPAWHSKRLREKALKSPLLRSVVFEDGMHNDTWEKGGARYWEEQTSFITDCLREPTPQWALPKG